jgi:RNA polymerase sigma-70 factor (ECF subfamily)
LHQLLWAADGKGLQMAAGNEKADFANIVLPYLSDALTMATWLAGNRADAEDIVQEGCLRAFRAISTYGGGSARAWTLTIVRNCAYAWLRNNRRAEFVSFDDLDEGQRARAELSGGDLSTSLASTPEAELISAADAESLRTAIEGLPPQFREVLVLRDIQGLDYREIAQVISVPLGTVMSRLARARRRLLMMIDSQEGGADAAPVGKLGRDRP